MQRLKDSSALLSTELLRSLRLKEEPEVVLLPGRPEAMHQREAGEMTVPDTTKTGDPLVFLKDGVITDTLTKSEEMDPIGPDEILGGTMHVDM